MRVAFIAAALLALGGCASVESGLGFLGRTPGTEDSALYHARAAAGDRFEVEAARLALARGRRADVRDLAQRLIDEHTATSVRLAAAAGAVPPPAELTPDQQRRLALLQAASDETFDAAFLREQIPAHEEAMRVHHAYALAGPSRDMREVAAAAVTTAHQHLDRVRQIQRFIAAGG